MFVNSHLKKCISNFKFNSNSSLTKGNGFKSKGLSFLIAPKKFPSSDNLGFLNLYQSFHNCSALLYSSKSPGSFLESGGEEKPEPKKFERLFNHLASREHASFYKKNGNISTKIENPYMKIQSKNKRLASLQIEREREKIKKMFQVDDDHSELAVDNMSSISSDQNDNINTTQKLISVYGDLNFVDQHNRVQELLYEDEEYYLDHFHDVNEEDLDGGDLNYISEDFIPNKNLLEESESSSIINSDAFIPSGNNKKYYIDEKDPSSRRNSKSNKKLKSSSSFPASISGDDCIDISSQNGIEDHSYHSYHNLEFKSDKEVLEYISKGYSLNFLQWALTRQMVAAIKKKENSEFFRLLEFNSTSKYFPVRHLTLNLLLHYYSVTPNFEKGHNLVSLIYLIWPDVSMGKKVDFKTLKSSAYYNEVLRKQTLSDSYLSPLEYNKLHYDILENLETQKQDALFLEGDESSYWKTVVGFNYVREPLDMRAVSERAQDIQYVINELNRIHQNSESALYTPLECIFPERYLFQLVSFYISHSRPGIALAILAKHLSLGARATPRIFQTYLNHVCNSQNLDTLANVENFWTLIIKYFGIFAYEPIFCKRLITVYRKFYRYDLISKLLVDMEALGVMGDESFISVALAHRLSDPTYEILPLVSELAEKDLLDLSHFHLMVNRITNEKQAISFLESIVSVGLTPTITTYNLIMKKMCIRYEDVLNWLDKINQAGLKPDSFTYENLIGSIIKNPGKNEATHRLLVVLKQMEQLDISLSPDSIIYILKYYFYNNEFYRCRIIIEMTLSYSKLNDRRVLETILQVQVLSGELHESIITTYCGLLACTNNNINSHIASLMLQYFGRNLKLYDFRDLLELLKMKKKPIPIQDVIRSFNYWSKTLLSQKSDRETSTVRLSVRAINNIILNACKDQLLCFEYWKSLYPFIDRPVDAAACYLVAMDNIVDKKQKISLFECFLKALESYSVNYHDDIKTWRSIIFNDRFDPLLTSKFLQYAKHVTENERMIGREIQKLRKNYSISESIERDHQEIKNTTKILDSTFTRATMQLAESFSNVESIKTLLYVLEESDKIKTITFTSLTLQRVFTTYFVNFTEVDLRQIRQRLLLILRKRTEWFVQTREHIFALSAFSRLMARVHRLCWFDLIFEIDTHDFDSNPTGNNNIMDDLRSLVQDISVSDSASKPLLPDKISGKRKVKVDLEDPMLHIVATELIVGNKISLKSNLLGCYLLNDLVEEMGINIPTQSIAFLCKVSVSFRERCLLTIFKDALAMASNLLETSSIDASDPNFLFYHELVLKTLQLTQTIFAFDFVGTHPDESSDEVGTIRLPTSWASTIFMPRTVSMFFEFYSKFNEQVSTKALEILSSMISIRISVFCIAGGENTLLETLFAGLLKILKEKIGLNNLNNRHHICRLLAKLKGNFHLIQFISLDTCNELFYEIQNFHQQILLSITDCTTNLIFYVMDWWSQMANTLTFRTIDENIRVFVEMCANIFRVFIESHLNYLKNPNLDKSEDLILFDKQFPQILNCLPPIIECTGKIELLMMLSNTLSKYMSLEEEYALAFLIQVVSAIFPQNALSVLMDSYVIDEQIQSIEATFVLNIFHIMNFHEKTRRSDRRASKCLDYAIICFLKRLSCLIFTKDEFEKTATFKALQENGCSTINDVLEIILEKIAVNMKEWSDDPDISSETIQLFSLLFSTRGTSKLLEKAPLVNYLLYNHDKLDLGTSKRNRSEFFKILGKISINSANVTNFERFVKPFDVKLQAIIKGINEPYPGIEDHLILVLDDLRGILSAFITQPAYELFYDWFSTENYLILIFNVLASKFLWNFNWRVICAILKFVEKFVSNSHKQIVFSNISTEGLELFKIISDFLTNVADQIMSPMAFQSVKNNDNDNSNYNTRDLQAKLIILYLRCFSKFFEGLPSYCHLGFFRLYKRELLTRFLKASLSILFSVDANTMQEYSKLNEAVYITLDILSCHNISELLDNIENASSTILSMLRYLRRGLHSKKIRIICYCTQSIDRIVTLQYEALHRQIRPIDPSCAILLQEHHRNILRGIIIDLLEVLILDRDSIHWTLCRPLFALIQLIPDDFEQLQDLICKSQNYIPYRSEYLKNEFKNLMSGVESSIKMENKEKFSSNAIEFKITCKNLINFHHLYKELSGVIPEYDS